MEFGANRGQSQVGLTTITAANAGYVPLQAPGSLPVGSIGRPANKTLTMQWTAIF